MFNFSILASYSGVSSSSSMQRSGNILHTHGKHWECSNSSSIQPLALSSFAQLIIVYFMIGAHENNLGLSHSLLKEKKFNFSAKHWFNNANITIDNIKLAFIIIFISKYYFQKK